MDFCFLVTIFDSEKKVTHTLGSVRAKTWADANKKLGLEEFDGDTGNGIVYDHPACEGTGRQFVHITTIREINSL